MDSVRRVRGRYELLLGGERYVLTRAQMEERPLAEGDELEPEEFERWVQLHQYRPALEYAVSLLAARPCARGEIAQKLRRNGYRPGTVELVIYKLEKHGLLDDGAFARQWAQARAGRRLGSRRIAMELRQKGVSAEETEAALTALDPEEVRQAALAIARRGLRAARPDEDRRKTAQRVLAALVRRGYSFEQAKEALREALAEQA